MGPVSSCTWWTGAVTARGHGRFWVGAGAVVIAHRFAFARANGVDELFKAPQLAHTCDNPLCQNQEHLVLSSAAQNAHEWAVRRRHFAGPLADPRGSRRRAIAIRDGLRQGKPLEVLIEEGRSNLERHQYLLW